MAGVLFLVRTLTASRPLVDLRGWAAIAREADLTGALLLAVGPLRRDPGVRDRRPARSQVFSDRGLWYLLGAAVAAVAFAVHLRRAEAPLIPHRRAAPHARLGLAGWSASSSGRR